MKKELFTNLKLIIIGLVLAVGASYAFADYKEPAGDPPGNNTERLVSVGTQSDVKTGSLTVGTFAAAGAAQFNKSVFFDKYVIGIPSADGKTSTVVFGGDIGQGKKIVNLSVRGDLKATGDLYADNLKATPDTKLCATGTGEIVFCLPDPMAPPVTTPVTPPTKITVRGNYSSFNTVFIATLSQPVPFPVTAKVSVFSGTSPAAKFSQYVTIAAGKTQGSWFGYGDGPSYPNQTVMVTEISPSSVNNATGNYILVNY